MGREFKKIIPKENLIVRFPNTKTILPQEGATVPWVGKEGRFWRRRLRDGDVILFEEKEKTKYYSSKKETKEEN